MRSGFESREGLVIFNFYINFLLHLNWNNSYTNFLESKPSSQIFFLNEILIIVVSGHYYYYDFLIIHFCGLKNRRLQHPDMSCYFRTCLGVIFLFVYCAFFVKISRSRFLGRGSVRLVRLNGGKSRENARRNNGLFGTSISDHNSRGIMKWW